MNDGISPVVIKHKCNHAVLVYFSKKGSALTGAVLCCAVLLYIPLMILQKMQDASCSAADAIAVLCGGQWVPYVVLCFDGCLLYSV